MNVKRSFFEIIDGILTGAYSVVIWRYEAREFEYPSTDQLAWLGASAGLLAIAYRQFGKSAELRDMRGVQSKTLLAAASSGTAVGTVLFFCYLLLPRQTWLGLEDWARWWALAAMASSVILSFVVRAIIPRRGFAPRAAVISTRVRDSNISRFISYIGVWNEVVEFYDDEELGPLVEAAKRGHIGLLVLCMANSDRSSIGRICDLFAEIPVRVCLAVDPTSLGGAPQPGPFLLLDLATSPPGFWMAFLKRLEDIIGSSVALVLCLPILIIAALAIRLETDGPVIFRQLRSGRAGCAFEIFKLRTMHIEGCDARGERQTSQQDPRLTRVGRLLRRTSIDELPQLVNVLRGDMSLVGPRAHPIHMKVEGRYYADAVSNYRVRHRIKPGITGWAQINGSRGPIEEISSAQRRVELDLFYLNNLSLPLDVYIIIRTIFGGFIATDM